MPMVLPAPVTPAEYSGVTLYLAARSRTVYSPGKDAAAAFAVGMRLGTSFDSPVATPEAGWRTILLWKSGRPFRPCTALTMPDRLAGTAVTPTGASYLRPSAMSSPAGCAWHIFTLRCRIRMPHQLSVPCSDLRTMA